MLSRRNVWLLVALPLALILIWAAQQGAEPSEEGADAGPPPLGRGLIYLSPASGEGQLFHFDLESDEVQQIGNASAVSSFNISADGGSLIYSAANALGGSDLWEMELRSRESHLLLDCAAQDCSLPSFSPDGSLLAYQVDFASIWLLDLASGDSLQASPTGQLSRDPIWSADGRLSYYNQTAARYEIVLSGESRLTRHPNQTGERLSWAADGSSFVAAEQIVSSIPSPSEATPSAVSETPQPTEAEATSSPAPTAIPAERLVSRLMRYALNEAEALFDVGDNLVEDTSPAFSPDGRWLAFTRKYLDEERWTPGRQLWLYELESGLALAFSDSPNFHISAPTWSADSQQIAFLRSNRAALNEPLELWVIHVNGSGARLLVVDAFAPEWLR